MSMSVFEAIQKRCSVRSFAPRAVPPETLRQVLQAGLDAPSARNMQDWRFVVVTDAETRAQLAEAAKGQSFVAEAPAVIVACGTSDHVMTCGQKCSPIDVAIAVDHMTLTAVELGLGSCWVGAFYQDQVKRLLGIPEEVAVVALLPIGYPAHGRSEPKSRHPFEQMVAFGRWGWTDGDGD